MITDAGLTYAKALAAGAISIIPVKDDPFGNTWRVKTFSPIMIPIHKQL